MKRYSCLGHVHHVKVGKSVTMDSQRCSICRFHDRPKSLADVARLFENAAELMRMAHENPDYDPIGLSWASDVEKAMLTYLRAINPAYRKSVLATLNQTGE